LGYFIAARRKLDADRIFVPGSEPTFLLASEEQQSGACRSVLEILSKLLWDV